MLNPDWLVPDWPAPAGVRAVFTSRAGGVSAAPYDSLNLGDHVGDLAKNVQANRSLLHSATGPRLVFLKQVHGCEVLTLAGTSRDGQEVDACITIERQLACTIMVADCLPVLLATTDGSVVAAAHAGWRGLAGGRHANGNGHGGVLEAVYASFITPVQSPKAPVATKVIAWLGPCIGQAAFEVGAEVMAAFTAVVPGAEKMFKPVDVRGSASTSVSTKYLADLQGLARLRLNAMGITQIYGNDGSTPWCTFSNPSRFFSHRRDAGVGISLGGSGNGFGTTGRMAACIWRE